MKHDKPDPDTSLGMKTKLRLDLVIILLGAAASVGIISAQIQMIRADMRRVWTVPEQRIYTERLAVQNPALRVPEIDEVIKDVRGNN